MLPPMSGPYNRGPAGDLPMTVIGTPLAGNATRLLLLGSGELGKEVAIEAMRYGVEVIAVDRYADAPAMLVANRSHVVDMLDPAQVRRVIEVERPDLVVPEIEAIHTPTLLELEAEGVRVIPTARAARLTMDREGIRRLAAETLGLPTSPYRFVDSAGEYRAAVAALGMPCVVKPVMSSSGKGQSTVRAAADIDLAWEYAQRGGRAGAGRVIVEGFVPFDYEITLLTVRHAGGTSFCAPIGHLQEQGDYIESWQPQPMSALALDRAQAIAAAVTGNLCGRGLFGVELFVRGDDVLFSEVSPRPHDTGLVTLASQDLSQFALHVRAILELPIPAIVQRGPSASAAILANGDGRAPSYHGLAEALAQPGTEVRIFGKPEVRGRRRLAVALARGETIDAARSAARSAAAAIRIDLD
jgi:phosphoribosylglycinamide formyltransferase 2